MPTFTQMNPSLQTLRRHAIRVRIQAQLKPLKRPLLTSMLNLPRLSVLVIENHVWYFSHPSQCPGLSLSGASEEQNWNKVWVLSVAHTWRSQDTGVLHHPGASHLTSGNDASLPTSIPTGTAGREAEDTGTVLPSSASTSYGLSKVALLPLWIMTARETTAALSTGAESLSNHSSLLRTLVYKCHLQRTEYGGSFYLHGSNLRVHSKSLSLKNFRSSRVFSSCMCVHVLRTFLPSIPVMSAYRCHLLMSGNSSALLQVQIVGVCMSEYLEKTFRACPYVSEVPLTCQQVYSFSQGWEQTLHSWVLSLCCTKTGRRLLFLIFSVTGSSGCIRAHWALLLDRQKREVWEAFFSCAVRWAVVLIQISVKAPGDRCRQHHCPSYWSLYTWHLFLRGTGSVVPTWEGDLKNSRPQVDTMKRAIGNPWKADTVDLKPPAANPASCMSMCSLWWSLHGRSWAVPAGQGTTAWTCDTSAPHCRPSVTLHSASSSSSKAL